MELRHYLHLLRRYKWFILMPVVVLGVLAGGLASRGTPIYQASARVLLRPNDPAEEFNPANSRQIYADPDRYVSAQQDIVRSEAVAGEAAKLLPGVSVPEIEAAVLVRQAGQNDILEVSARSRVPARARDIANAVARGYLENRRTNAVAGLKRAADDIQAKLTDVQGRLAELDIAIADNGSQPKGTAPSTQPNKETLKAARDAAAVQYETLYSRQQELLVNMNLKRGEAELIADAKTPVVPVSPHPKRSTALGAFIGMLLGGGFVLVRDQLDDRVRSGQETEHLTGMRVLAELPFDEDSARVGSRLAAIERPLSPLTEAVRALRTSLQFVAVEESAKVIVVTSPNPGEGKSLVAANLAAVYAQAGYRAHLVSADLRRPSLSGLSHDADASPGLSGVIAQLIISGRAQTPNGPARVAELTRAPAPYAGNGAVSALVETTLPNLRLLPSGVAPPNPAELLGSSRMSQVLAELSASADIVIIDSPPVLPVTDAAVLAAKADGVVLVVALGETRRGSAQRAAAILEGHARILGTVVNKARASSGYDYYEQYKGYYSNADVPTNGRKRWLGRSRGPVEPTAALTAPDPWEPNHAPDEAQAAERWDQDGSTRAPGDDPRLAARSNGAAHREDAPQPMFERFRGDRPKRQHRAGRGDRA